MAQHYWHPVALPCPTCNAPKMSPVQIAFAADGRFLIHWVCVKCNHQMANQYEMAECICTAFQADLEQSFFATPAV